MASYEGEEVMSSETVQIQEQVIHDEASGVTLSIWQTPSGEGRIRIAGPTLPLDRDFQFDADGNLVGTGSAVASAAPTRLRVVS